MLTIEVSKREDGRLGSSFAWKTKPGEDDKLADMLAAIALVLRAIDQAVNTVADTAGIPRSTVHAALADEYDHCEWASELLKATVIEEPQP